MNKIFITGIIILIALVGVFFIGSTKTPSSLSFASITTDISKGAKLYDVRTPEEYKKEHFHSALNFPLQTMQAGSYPNVSKNTKLYLYCRSGNRSAQAMAILKKAGYTNVTDLGGLSKVQAMGGTLMKM